jgi:uncharacterized protein YutE (UPF0331/DUF86 family)
MSDDVILNKSATIEKCVARVKEEYFKGEASFDQDQTRQDAVILNIQRACEASIDMAQHVVRKLRLGVPQSASDVFVILAGGKLIEEELAQKLVRMVGFRNIAVHDYQRIYLPIVKTIMTEHLKDFTDFASAMLKL